ncbi:XRE family transcriptional regulator [uncultured Cloacibacillus sp.]|uniref:helix-turn-helix domain-containing protein n=1 Tax=uncultured Cloacibacillus sp. TaxID=889794 RepID=UPI0032095420
MEKELGQRIKARRIAQKMTLKKLSAETGLSISFLSMVERGQTSIAIVSLKKIADALSQNVTDFFLKDTTEDASSSYVIKHGYSPKIRSISGNYIYYSIGSNNPSFCLDPMLITLLPGQCKEDVVMLEHRGEEFTYVLEGIVSFFVNDQEVTLYPGDSYHGLGNFPHNFVNLSNNIAKVLYILTPPLQYGEEPTM